MLQGDSIPNTISSPIGSDLVTSENSVAMELSPEAQKLAFLRKFISNNIYKSEGENHEEIVELSEEERQRLFFAPEIELSKTVVEERRKNIEGSDFEIVKLDQPSVENNLLIAQENIVSQFREEYSRKKEPVTFSEKVSAWYIRESMIRNLEAHIKQHTQDPNSKQKAKVIEEMIRNKYPELIHFGFSGLSTVALVYSHLEKSLGNEEGVNLEEEALKLCSKLLPFRQEGNLGGKDKLSIGELGRYLPNEITEEQLLRITRATEDKWNTLTETLKRIPHLDVSRIKLGTIVEILDVGINEEVMRYIETLSRDGFLAEKNSDLPREKMVLEILGENGNLEGKKREQNFRRTYFYYGDKESRNYSSWIPKDVDENGVFRLNMLRYGLDIAAIIDYEKFEVYNGFLSKDLEEYSKLADEEKVRRAQVIDQKFRIIVELEQMKGVYEEHIEYILNFVQQEENKEIIERASLYQEKLSLKSQYLWSVLSNGVVVFRPMSKELIEQSLSDFEKNLINSSKDVDSGVVFEDRDALKEILEHADEKTLAKIRAAAFISYYFPLGQGGISREKFEEMALFEGGSYSFTEKALEYICSINQEASIWGILREEPAYPKLLQPQIVENFKNPDAVEFWSFLSKMRGNSYIATDVANEMFSYLRENSYNYGEFLKNYTVELNGEDSISPKRLLKQELFFKVIGEGSDFGDQLEQDDVKLLELFDLDPILKKLWSRAIEIDNPVVRQSLFTFYRSKGEDFTVADIEIFFELASRIENTPSKEMYRLKDQIIAQLSSNIERGIDTVIEQYEILENLFVRNNSPVSVLRYKVFDKLFSEGLLNYSEIDSKISKIFSDTLSNSNLEEEQKEKIIMELIKKDLLKVAKDSVDENFYNFMISLRDSISAIDFYDRYLQEGFTDEELIEILGDEGQEFMMKSLDIFFTTSNFISRSKEISSRIEELREFLGVHKSQQLVDGIYSFFLEPLNIPQKADLSESISLLIEEIQEKKQDAHNRGIQYYQNGLSVNRGDLIKGISSDVLGVILGEGVLSKDFLGASAHQDATPYDTDTQMILQVSEGESIIETLNQNAAERYGDIFLIFRDRGQFTSSANSEENIDPDKYELIHSEVVSDKHYGIRTGIASTEIDFIYCQGMISESKLRQIKFDITRMGVYIPVLDSENNIVFTPEEFEKGRATFKGVRGIKGEKFDVNMQNNNNEIKSSLESITINLEEEQKRVSNLNSRIESVIKGELLSKGFTFETSRTGLEGLRVENVGSTSRWTHVSGVSDFDFSVLMDKQQLKMIKSVGVEEVINSMIETLGEEITPGKIFQTEDGGIQLVGSEIKLRESGEIIEFDLAITDKKDNLDKSNTHNKIIERLESIRIDSEMNEEEAYKYVLSNIIFAKKFLKENECYKKGAKEGGLGGVGVENWILQHNGNFEEAAIAFLRASTTESGEEKDYPTFMQDYTVWDAGRDIRTGAYDEFVSQNMTAEGYRKMREALLNLLDF